MKLIKRVCCALMVSVILMPCRGLDVNVPDDNNITFGIKEALREDPRIYSGNIQVFVKDGKVRLSGTVYNLVEKNFALKEAKKIDGVVSVIDSIEVKPTYQPDDGIKESVHHRLRTNPALHKENIEVNIKDGLVTLTGQVSSISKIDEATLVVSQIAGVKTIQSKLEVVLQQDVSDADIEADLLQTIKRDVYLTGLPIQVSVKDGVVALSGYVANAYQKDRAEIKSLWIRNIKEVRNEIIVDPTKERGERKRRPQLTDEEIRKTILATLAHDSRISQSASFDIRVESGYVALRGTVPSTLQREIAEQDVRNVVGVAWVTNRLVVIPERRNDSNIEEDIILRFESDYMLFRHALTAASKDGVVTLSGQVNTAYAKMRAGKLIKRILGVRQVINNIDVKEPRIYRNATLEKQIRERLGINWETALIADSIKVKVKHGKATLTGVVPGWGQLREAERIAYFTDGIWAVDNRLEVKDVDYEWEQWYFDYPDTYFDEFYPGYDSYYHRW